MDAIAEWTSAYERVCELVQGIGAEQAAASVPACPDWSVRELLSHMIGLDADVLAGDEPDDHNAGWTQRQVDERQGRPVEDLLDEWASLAGSLQQWMRDNSTRPLGDVIIHEQDLRGALGEPGGRDTDGLHAIRDRMAGRVAAGAEGMAPIALVGEQWTWCSSGDAADAAVVLRADDFDLARAVMSRRSADQLRSWVERGDVEPYLAAFGGLGSLPDHDLPE